MTDAQDAILQANPLYCPNGAHVRPEGQAATVHFTGPVYVLPAPAYRALMLSD